MNIYATHDATRAWASLDKYERARTLAATYFTTAKWSAYSEGGEKGYKKDAVDALTDATGVDEYCGYWSQFADSLPAEHSRCVQATLISRLLVNLTGSIQENAGIALEHTCGIPIIPGSAVKGAARRYAIALLQETPEEEQKLELLESFISIFGCVQADFEPGSDLALAFTPDVLSELGKEYKDRKGKVCFLQAVPLSPVDICAEVLTPHHKEYMEGKKAEPTDDEEPSPSYFPAVECDGKTMYSFVLYAPKQPELLDTAEEWLRQAISLFGIGAKTAAGYGYFNPVMQGLTQEQSDAIQKIATKKKLDDMFKLFHKKKDKDPLHHWALLYAIALPESDPTSRVKEYREFLAKDPKSSQEQKALEAMQQMAQEHNINLPQ